MNISQSHLLIDAHQKPIPGGRPMNIRRCVVIHFTAGATGLSSISYWKQPAPRKIDLGAHIVIERTGDVYQCRAFNKTISHAGKSRWDDPKTGKHYDMCNQFSIGIELANAGDDPQVIKIARTLPGFAGTIRAKHRNGGPTKDWEAFSDAQFISCVNVVRQLVERYNLDDVTSHDAIAPERKNDVGPAFPMKELRDLCGFGATEPEVHWP